MSRWYHPIMAVAYAFVLASTVPGIVLASDDEDERGDLVLTGDKICTRCHDEYEYYPVLTIGQTLHGNRADERTPNCTSCHGDSQAHLDGSEDEDTRPLTDVNFGKASQTPVAQRDQQCLACHQGGGQIHWQLGAHAANDVGCSSCHQVHAPKDPVTSKATQAQVCFECHKQQRMESQRFSRHPLQEGKVVCSDCHNPHGTSGLKGLVRDSVVDTCYQCHAEKRGPFIWNHEPVSEDCGYCHNPHGSNINGMLKTRAPMLCQNCHEGDAHRGTPADESSPYTTGRGCLNCHTNVHGSNSPEGSVSTRSLQK